MIYEEISEVDDFGNFFNVQRHRPDLVQEMMPDFLINWKCVKGEECEYMPCIICRYDKNYEKRLSEYQKVKQAVEEDKLLWFDVE